MTSPRILVVEDDASLARTLGISLRARGYDVDAVPAGRPALGRLRSAAVDLVLLDLGLPDIDGVEVLRTLRQGGDDTPVVVLSARRESEDKVAALDAGADDYVTKPFGTDELMARVRAALRRGNPARQAEAEEREGDEDLPDTLATPHFTLDFGACSATAGGSGIRLTPTEWRLLAALARHPGQVVPHEELLHAAWGPSYGRESNYLRVYANQLRRKLEPDPSRPRYLVTVPGVGYRLDPAGR